ncbi:50S ribosomal protein L25 [Candidatus Roizmanbacteria bacterium]|nr:50S ribosomal protein L25 [Candidatus Roizmanbacteria bacterium]
MTKTNKTSINSQDKLILTLTPRTIYGKKLKKIRKEGNIPSNIYGPDFKSQAVIVSFKDFAKVYKVVKETGVVYLQLDKQELPVLIKNIQYHPVNDHILHVDFRKIDLKQKIQTAVPVKIVGQSEAVVQKGGVLLTLSETLQVEALPSDIPKYIEVDISQLKEIKQEIKVSDLVKTERFEIKELTNKVIVSVVEHKEESITPETAQAAAPEVITAKPEEGEVPAEGSVTSAPAGEPTAKAGAKPAEQVKKPTVVKSSEANKPSLAKASEGKPAEGKK